MASRVSKITTDHDEIRRWAEERGATPSCVRRTGGKGDVGILRLDFPGYSGETSLEPIDWDQWFQKFDESNLALLYEETTSGGQKSNFNKLVSRETAEAAQRGGARTAGKASSKGGKKTAAKKAAAGKSAGAGKSAAAGKKSAAAKKTGAAKKGATKSSGGGGSRAKTASGGKATGKKTAAKKSSTKKSAGGKTTAAKKSSRSRGR